MTNSSPIILFFLLLNGLLFSSYALTDEIRPGYLELTSDDAEHYDVTFKLPKKNNRVLVLDVIFPENCKEDTARRYVETETSKTSSWSIYCQQGISGQTLKVEGLDNTMTELLVRIQESGHTQIKRLFTTHNQFLIEAQPSKFDVIKIYTVLGIEHILMGFDHLLFVFALLLIIKGRRKLLATITAFTVAHSITLVLASLNIASVPLPPVEAVIALSILFLAVEVIHAQKGSAGIAEKSPWLVAFAFGLLHGFGFAGALAEIGLPQNEVPLALLFFNVGVELRQVIFVTLVIIVANLLKPFVTARIQQFCTITLAYMIGSLATFWVYERTCSFLLT